MYVLFTDQFTWLIFSLVLSIPDRYTANLLYLKANANWTRYCLRFEVSGVDMNINYPRIDVFFM
jgi:hypothetical protein